ncbi:MAG TPA: endonuclease/exonuclease/phosphatase family protein, partial [Phenylobacterium sp.]|nr:endonuclease/exonuclease/phosphatase family protein [Phenylobacterium sp.]
GGGSMTTALRRGAQGAARGLAALAVANAAVAVAAAAGALDARLDLLANLAPLYGIVAVALVVGGVLLRADRPILLAAAAVGLAASAALIAPEVRRDAGPTAPADAPGQIKVIQINALRTNSDIKRVADWLIAERPDIVTISEARHDLRDLILRRTGWKTAGAAGNLLVLTPKAYERMTRPKAPRGSLLTFVNATYEIEDQPTEIVTTHLLHPSDPAQAPQRRDLAGVVATRPRERMIVTGDFNDAPWSHGLRELDGSLGLIRRDRAVPSYPAQLFGRPWPWPFLPIDHVYAGPAWATVSVTRGPWLGSDHYPIVVILAPVAPR